MNHTQTQHNDDTVSPQLSLVVPVYNEEENLPVLVGEIAAAMNRVGKNWELILIDDGSTDTSVSVMERLRSETPQVEYIVFEKNCGQSFAFAAGFAAARGELIITLDADLQNDPADIPAMLELYFQGYDMVVGWRANRKDTWAKRMASKLGNAIRNRLSHESIKDTGCSLKILRSSMAKRLPMFTGMHRFLPTLMKLYGARVAETKVNHRPRLYGVSKYGIWDRARTTFFDLLAIRWMQARHVNYTIKKSSQNLAKD